MTAVTHATVASLRCALVEAHLQIQLALAGTQLLFGKGTLVLFGHFRSQRGASVFGMQLGLRAENILETKFCDSFGKTYNSGQRVQAQSDLRDVATLKQIGCLEDFCFRHAVLLNGRLESMDKKKTDINEPYTHISKIGFVPLNIFHQLKVGTTFLDFLDSSGRQFVGQTTQNSSVLKNVFVLTGWHRFAKHSKHPCQNFSFLILVTWLSGLKKKKNSCFSIIISWCVIT